MKNILKNKLYMTVFITDMISNFGDVLYYLALMNYVLLLPNSKYGVSIVSFSEILPIVGSVFAGYYADKKKDKIKSILNTLICRTILYLIVAFVIGFSPSLWIVIVASFINFISDVLGQYENGLYSPISVRIIANENRQEAIAFRQSISTGLNVVFQSIGVLLLSIMTYSQIALLNSLTFLICFVIIFTIKSKIENILDKNPIKIDSSNSQESKISIKTFYKQLKYSVHKLLSIDEIKSTMIAVPILNSGLAVLTPIILLLIIVDKSVIVINTQTTIVLTAVLSTVGTILGSVLTMGMLKNVSINKILKVEVFVMIILFVSLYVHKIYYVLFLSFISSVLVGCLNPKMGALIINNMPEDKLGTIIGGMTTYFSLGNIIAKLIFSLSVLVLSFQSIVSMFLFISVILFIYIIRLKNN